MAHEGIVISQWSVITSHVTGGNDSFRKDVLIRFRFAPEGFPLNVVLLWNGVSWNCNPIRLSKVCFPVWTALRESGFVVVQRSYWPVRRRQSNRSTEIQASSLCGARVAPPSVTYMNLDHDSHRFPSLRIRTHLNKFAVQYSSAPMSSKSIDIQLNQSPLLWMRRLSLPKPQTGPVQSLRIPPRFVEIPCR